MNRFIERLGDEVEISWKKEGYVREVFSEIAYQVLKKSGVSEQLTMEEVLLWLQKTKDLPEQLSLDQSFGSPPITLYHHSHFLIDVYFWVAPEMSIHSHGFQGAFAVLEGNSLHCRYQFPIRENFKDDILIGNLHLEEAVLLRKGEVHEIPMGTDLIHQVWHLSSPTVSLAIRTPKKERLQYNYFKPHLSLREQFPIPPLQIKRSDALRMLYRTKHPRKERFLKELLLEGDPLGALWILLKYFKDTNDLKGIQKILPDIPKLQRWIPSLLESFKYLYETTVDWAAFKGEEEKLFLALLCSVDKKDQIEHFIQRYYPERNPEQHLMEWLTRLAKRKGLGFRLNETALEVLALLLRGCEEEEICRELSTTYDVENSIRFLQEIRTLCKQLRSLPLFKPLLSSLPQEISL